VTPAPNGVGFAGRVGIIAGAALAVISLGNALGGLALRTMVAPEIERILVQERHARVAADSTLAISIAQLSADRLIVLTILEYPPGPDRSAAIRRARTIWLRR